MSKIWDAMKQAERERELLDEPEAEAPVEPLTPKQLTAVSTLLDTDSLADAAQAAGVSENTLRRWLALPHFVAAYDAETHGRYGSAMALLRAASGEAAQVLRLALRGEVDAVRVQAAVAVLDLANKAEMADAMVRVGRRRRPKSAG